MKYRTFAWRAGLALALIGVGLILLGAFVMLELGAMATSFTLMLLGFVTIIVAQVTGSLATGQQGLHYIY